MKKIITTLLFLCSLLAGQSDSLAWLDFFPMHTGDRWQYLEKIYDVDYSIRERTVTAKIVGDSVAANGKTYFYFKPRLPDLYSDLIRIDTIQQRIYAYHPDHYPCPPDSELLIFDFSILDNCDQECLDCCYLCESCSIEYESFTTFADTLDEIYCQPPETFFRLAAQVGLSLIGYTLVEFANFYSIIAAEIDGKIYGEFVEADTASLWFLDYFPMHVGDQWQYLEKIYDGFSYSDATEQYVMAGIVGDSVAANGKQYYFFDPPLPEINANLLRLDTLDQRIYAYEPESADCSVDGETVVFDFSLPGSDTAECPDCYTLCGICSRWTITYPAPFYSLESVYCRPSDKGYKFAKNLGLAGSGLDYPYGRHAFHLVAANIDGKMQGEWLGVESVVTTPVTFRLEQNYPNPFNPSTTLGFDLPAATNITLIVYDLTGREVARLADRGYQAGYHQVVWDGKNASGRPLPSGIYIARLTTPGYTKSIKMVLLK